MDSLEELFEDQIKDLYNAENQLIKALPKMAKRASSAALKEAIESHLDETKIHAQRLEKIGKLLDFKVSGKVCKAMQGLVEEGKEVLDEDGDGPVIDAAIIGAAQRVEHYEIAGYGCVRAMAEELGNDEVANILQETLDEEGAADKKLTEIAESEILQAAHNGNGEEA
jgi:ferritin-like metal-binding protein YciE